MGGPNPNAFTGGTAATLPGNPWAPGDNGLLAATGDPAMFVNTTVLTAGTLYLAKLIFRQAITVTNLWFGMTVAGVGASTGSFAGLYNSAGTLLSGSADIAATLTGATGGISVPLSTPQAVTASSFAWAAILVNLATTQPSLSRNQGTNTVADLNLTAATFRFAVNGTGLLSLPGSITPASNSTTNALTLLVGAN